MMEIEDCGWFDVISFAEISCFENYRILMIIYDDQESRHST